MLALLKYKIKLLKIQKFAKHTKFYQLSIIKAEYVIF